MRTTSIATFIALLIVMLPICHAAELNLQYDGNGNLITGDGKFRVFNAFNQLWKIYNGTSTAGPLLEEYSYHPVEERVLMKKVYNTTDASVLETVYYFSEDNVRVVNSSGTYDYKYIFHAGQLVAQEVNGVRYYISGNHEGSSSVVTAVNQSVVESTEYSPFGEVVSGGKASRFGYEGQEYSSVTGDMDFHFRKYNPGWGLFLQPDTMIQNVYDPQSLNHYMFERANPYKIVDPTGHGNINVINTEWSGSPIDVINAGLATGLAKYEVNDQNEKKEYERLYAEYQKEHLDLPSNPYTKTWTTGSNVNSVRDDRRISLDTLRTWKSEKVGLSSLSKAQSQTNSACPSCNANNPLGLTSSTSSTKANSLPTPSGGGGRSSGGSSGGSKKPVCTSRTVLACTSNGGRCVLVIITVCK